MFLTPATPCLAIGRLVCLTVFSMMMPALGSTLLGQDADQQKSPTPTPITTANAQIPLTHLEILLKPLTQEELVVEVEGWRDLVKMILTESGDIQIKVSSAKNSNTSMANPPVAAQANATNLAEQLAAVQVKQTSAISRLKTTIDALEKKGGDVESYRQYVGAITGLNLATDAVTTWTIVKNWFTSDQGGKKWMWNLIKFFLVLAAFYFGATIIGRFARHAVSRVAGVSQLLTDFVGSFVKQLLMVIGFIVSLAALEINIAPLLAAIGATGFVIGLALQGTLSNFASGLLILFYRPFDVGDVIDAGGVSGIVNSVTLVSTHVRTFDNKVMIVPNNDIWGGTITNATASDTRRVDMVFGIGYDDDIERAKEILERLVSDHPLVHNDPVPVIRLNELADSSLNFICRPWSNTEDYWTVYWDITKSVKKEFDKNGISFPYPQRDVHVYQQTASD